MFYNLGLALFALALALALASLLTIISSDFGPLPKKITSTVRSSLSICQYGFASNVIEERNIPISSGIGSR